CLALAEPWRHMQTHTFTLGLSSTTTAAIPTHRRMTAGVYGIALIFHVLFFTALVLAGRQRLVRVVSGDVIRPGITAFVPGRIGGGRAKRETGTPIERPKAAEPPEIATSAPPAEPQDDAAVGSTQAAGSSGSIGEAGGGSATGPVRLGSSGDLVLLRKVQPVYPRQLEAARIPGTVILDAVIHRDGSIGDVRILQSSNAAFAQAAVSAVKQWRYTPIPYEGVLTVTVNFTLSS